MAGAGAGKSRYPAAMARTRAVVVASVAAASVLGASVLGWWLGGLARAAQPVARVVEVIDGDTVVVEFSDHSTDTVRLLGVDTPETKHPTKGVECFGPEAERVHHTSTCSDGSYDSSPTSCAATSTAGASRTSLCTGTGSTTCWWRVGYARFLVIPPNDLHARDLLTEELAARRHRRGLWGQC